MTKLDNKGKGNVSNRDDWQTPQWLFNKLNEQYRFTFDCCASKENRKHLWYSNDFLNIINEIGQAQYISDHTVWMNPPFSKAPEMIRHFFEIVDHGVSIYRMDNMETKIWQHILAKSDWIHIFDKRINYEGKAGKGAVFGSALFGIGVEPPKDFNGTTMIKYKDVTK